MQANQFESAVGYCRFSTSRQNYTSIEVQIESIQQYCERNGLKLVDVYIDEAKTGTNDERPDFQRLRNDARKGQFKHVIFYDVTRGSRDIVDWFMFRKEMREIGIRVSSCTENLGDIQDPGAFLTEAITVSVGQHQVLQSRQKSIEGKRKRAEKGLFCGGVPPLGYDIANGLYVVNQREAAAVRLIFSMYANGASYNEITAKVAEMGVVGKRGRPIGDNTLYYILRNQRYLGTFIWFEYEMRNMHHWVGKKNEEFTSIEGGIPQIIDLDTWLLVEKRIAEHQQNTMNKGQRRKYLLTGLIKCKKCGGAMTGLTRTVKKKSGLSYTYSCYTCSRKGRDRSCKCRNIDADELENQLKKFLLERILHPTFFADVVERMERGNEYLKAKSVGDLHKEIARVEESIENLWQAIESGHDSEDVHVRIHKNKERLNILQKDLEETNAVISCSQKFNAENLKKDAENALKNPDCLSEMIRKYISRVEVDDDEVIVHAIPVNLYQKTGRQLENELSPWTGSPGRARTYNNSVNSRVLYH